MSEINAGTLGDKKVADARNELVTVLGDIKDGIDTITGEVPNVASEQEGITQGNIYGDTKPLGTPGQGTIRNSLEAFKASEHYENLTDVVKAEFENFGKALDILEDAASKLDATQDNNKVDASGEHGSDTKNFLAAFEDFNKAYDSLTKVNAAQTADLNEMRGKLQSFVASPEDKDTKLDSTNFTAFIDTLDTALSKISEKRAMLGER